MFVLVCFVFYWGFVSAQVINPVSWVFSTRNLGPDEVELIFEATIQPPWHMYGLHIPEGGPIATSIRFNGTEGFRAIGAPEQAPEPEIVDDQIFNMELELHNGKVTFTQRIEKTSTDSIIIEGTMEYMTCSNMQCVLGDHDFAFRLGGRQGPAPGSSVTPASGSAGMSGPINSEETGEAVQVPDAIKDVFGNDSTSTAVPATAPERGSSSSPVSGSLLGILLLSMVAGLGGLLTPCVYPMIPMTVSYFLRGEKSRARAVSQALVFGLSIVLIYTLIGGAGRGFQESECSKQLYNALAGEPDILHDIHHPVRFLFRDVRDHAAIGTGKQGGSKGG